MDVILYEGFEKREYFAHGEQNTTMVCRNGSFASKDEQIKLAQVSSYTIKKLLIFFID